MSDHLHLIKPPERQPDPGFVMTETATNIARSLDLVAHEPGTLTRIAGIPGCGKSETIKRYAEGSAMIVNHQQRWQGKSRHVQLFTIVAGEGRVWDLAAIMMERFEIGTPNSRRMREDRLRIMEAIGPDRVLVFGEAQDLANDNPRGGVNFDAYEWLRAMAEETGFSVVF